MNGEEGGKQDTGRKEREEEKYRESLESLKIDTEMSETGKQKKEGGNINVLGTSTCAQVNLANEDRCTPSASCRLSKLTEQ